MFYLTTHSTHFIYGSMSSDHIWLYGKGPLCERGNPQLPHGILNPISSKGYFIVKNTL